MADVIKEFLVKLGFKLDEDGVKKFQAGIASVTKEVTGLGLKAAGAATAVTAAVTKIAEQYEELYFAAIRTGSSASALSTFAFGSKAIGIEAGVAATSLERLNIQLKTNPGFVSQANRDGIKTFGRETKDVYNDIIKMFAARPKDPMSQALMYMQAQGIYGISAAELIQRIPLIKEQAEAEEYHNRIMALSGVHMGDLASKSEHLMHTYQRLGAAQGMLWDSVAEKWIPAIDAGVGWLNNMQEVLLKTGKDTGGFTNQVYALATALGVLSSFSWLLKLLGLKTAGDVAAIASGGPIGAVVAGGALAGLATYSAVKNTSQGQAYATASAGNAMLAGMDPDLAFATAILNSGPPDPENNTTAPATPSPGGIFKSQAEKEAYIRAAFIKNGHNPDIAMQVALSEGFNKFAGDRDLTWKPTSFGAFQLHYPGIGKHTSDGLGTQFTKDTGLDARDPANERATIDWTAANVGKLGWGHWHGYSGGAFDGLNRNLVPPTSNGGASGDVITTTITNHNNVTIIGGDADKNAAAVKRELSTPAEGVRQSGTAVR